MDKLRLHRMPVGRFTDSELETIASFTDQMLEQYRIDLNDLDLGENE